MFPPGMGQGPQMMPPGMGGAPPEQGPPRADPKQMLRKVVDDITLLLAAEPDDQDSQLIAKGLALFQTILANRQKEQQAALGASPALRAMSRAG